MKGFLKGILVVCMIALLAGPAFSGQSAKDLATQMEKLMEQVKSMDAAMQAQKAEIEALQNKLKELASKEAVPAAAAPAAAAKVTSKYDIKLYGKIKFDGIYDTNNMGKDEFITYVPKSANGEDKATFQARDTRLGIAIGGPSLNGWAASARFETDFYGSDGGSSNGALRLRLAYVNFEKDGTSVRIGQDWNQIAGLNPSTLDFAIMGYNGNLWNRVPQVTLRHDLGDGLQGLVTVYRNRWSDDDDSFGSAKNDVQIHMPWVGGKIAYSGKLFDPNRNAYIAVDGAFRSGEANGNDVTPYLAAVELKVPFDLFELTGEGYIGQGLGLEYFHHTGTFNSAGNAVLTSGGFLQVSANPVKQLTLNVGYGTDNPKNDDVGSDFYQQSRYLFGNLVVQLFKDISAGIEAAHVNTDWSTGDKHGTRYTTSVMYNW